MGDWETPVAIVLPAYVLAIAVGIILIYKLSKNKTRKVSTLRLFIQEPPSLAISGAHHWPL